LSKAIVLSYQTKTETERYEIKLDSVKHNQPLDRAQFDFPQMTQAPLPDLSALINEIGRNTAERERLLEDYGYVSLETEREFDKDGSLKKNETREYQHTRYRGRRLRRLVAVNGRALGAAEQKKEDERVADEIKEIEKSWANWRKILTLGLGAAAGAASRSARLCARRSCSTRAGNAFVGARCSSSISSRIRPTSRAICTTSSLTNWRARSGLIHRPSR
jgi:hypothetical protein